MNELPMMGPVDRAARIQGEARRCAGICERMRREWERAEKMTPERA